MKVKQAPGGNFFDRLQNKLCYNEVNVVEVSVVSLIFFFKLHACTNLKQSNNFEKEAGC